MSHHHKTALPPKKQKNITKILQQTHTMKMLFIINIFAKKLSQKKNSKMVVVASILSFKIALKPTILHQYFKHFPG